MNDIMAITNPEVSNISNAMRINAERITMALGLKNAWDLRLACQLSAIGMLADIKVNKDDDIQSPKLELDIEKINEYLNLSTQVIEKIPRLEPVIKILDLSQLPLDETSKNKQISMIKQDALKGHILRILFHYFHKMQDENNHVSVLKQMRNDHEESYLVEILDILNEIKNNQFKNKILQLELLQITSGMILVEDIVTSEGRILLKAGYELSDSTIAILKRYSQLKERKFKVIRKVG